MNKLREWISIIITVVGMSITGAIGYGTLKADVSTNTTSINRIETKMIDDAKIVSGKLDEIINSLTTLKITGSVSNTEIAIIKEEIKEIKRRVR